MGMGPVSASRKALERAGWKAADVDLFEMPHDGRRHTVFQKLFCITLPQAMRQLVFYSVF